MAACCSLKSAGTRSWAAPSAASAARGAREIVVVSAGSPLAISGHAAFVSNVGTLVEPVLVKVAAIFWPTSADLPVPVMQMRPGQR